MMIRNSLCIGLMTLGVAGCDSHDHHEADLGVDACEHLLEGPNVAVTAASDPATATAAASLHTRLDVTLVSVDDAPGGYLAIAVSEAGAQGFFFDTAVTLAVTDANGAVVAPTASGVADPDCAEVASWFTFDLGVGTHILKLAAAEGTTDLSLVHVYADNDHGH